jgi:hypothetical protein
MKSLDVVNDISYQRVTSECEIPQILRYTEINMTIVYRFKICTIYLSTFTFFIFV